MHFTPPPHDCPLCPRLAAFREQNRRNYPTFFNAPVPSFGKLDAELLVAGLAPGLKGANQTGRPFTGDYAGIILYSSLEKFGFAKGNYDPAKVVDGKGDGFELVNTRIANSVRCVPPENKPEPSEIKTCNQFLNAEIKAMASVKVILSLGLIAHKGVLMALGLKQSAYKFGHGSEHKLPRGAGQMVLLNSYHCSRYNINTGTLTQGMFDAIVERAASLL